MMSLSTGRSRYPFTATQWEELEHQALVFKYMASGIPVPPDLLFTIRRSLDSSLSSKFLIHQPPQHLGWSSFHMGFGRKIDPEPGRCRRTDGKKWRCSKEAYPDSKYCERHMHRGRNRSRKPVEILSATNNSTASSNPSTAISISSITNKNTVISSNVDPSSPTPNAHSLSSHDSIHHPYLSPHSSSSKPPPEIGLSSLDQHSTNFFLEPNSNSPYSSLGKDFSYGYGRKDETEGHAFLSGSSTMDDCWQLAPLTMGSSLMKHRAYSSSCSSGYQTPNDNSISRQQRQDHHNFYSYGMPLNSIERDIDQPKKVMHHFLDEWPIKDKDSEDALLNHSTQLSISMPNSMHDFFHDPKW